MLDLSLSTVTCLMKIHMKNPAILFAKVTGMIIVMIIVVIIVVIIVIRV